MVGRGRGGDVARVSDFFLFSKESKSEKRCFVFRGGGGGGVCKGGLASVSEFVFQKTPNLKKKYLFFFFFFGGGGGGGLIE